MRKINHILSLSAVLLLSTACGVEQLPDTDIAPPETNVVGKSGTKSVVITASIGSPDTRIAYTPDEEDIPGLNLEWEPGDKLGVVNCRFVPNWSDGYGTFRYAPWFFSPEMQNDHADYYGEIITLFGSIGISGTLSASDWEQAYATAVAYSHSIDASKYPVYSLTNVSTTAGGQGTFSGDIPVSNGGGVSIYLPSTPSGYIYYYPVADRNRLSFVDAYITRLHGTWPLLSLIFNFGLTGQTVTIGADGEIADHTLHHYNLMCSYTDFKENGNDLPTKANGSLIEFADDEVVHLHHLCALVSFDMPSIGMPVERIELECDRACFANSISFDYLLHRGDKVKSVGIDVTDYSDGSGRVKGYMMVNADAGVTGPFTVKVEASDGSAWHSKKLYVSDAKGMEAGKCYTFKPRLNPPKFAAGNIYWDGDQLTFDKFEQTDSDDDAVYFKWGSLIGISGDSEGIDSDTEIYVPIHSQPGEYAAKTFHDQFGDYGGIPGFDGEEFEYDQPTNNALLHKWGKENNYWSENDNDPKTGMRRNWYQGDICAFITQGEWRMPTKEDFLTSKPYTIDDVNETITAYEGWYTFKSMDFRYARTGELIGMGDGGYYWSGSVVKDNSKRSCMLYFDTSDDIADAGDTDDRQQAFPVRCVLNVVDDD